MKTKCVRCVSLLLSVFLISTLAVSGQENNDEPIGASLDEVQVLIIPAGVVGFGLPSGKVLVITPDGVEVRDAVDPDEEEISKVYNSRTREQIPEGDLQRLQDELKPAVLTLIEALEQEQEGVEEEDVSLIVQLAILLGIRFTNLEEIRISDALGLEAPIMIPGLRGELLAEVNRILLRGSELADSGLGRGDPLEQEDVNLLAISTDTFDRLIALGMTPEQILEVRFNGAQAGQNLSQALLDFGLTPGQIVQVFPPPPGPTPPPIDPEPYAAPGF